MTVISDPNDASYGDALNRFIEQQCELASGYSLAKGAFYEAYQHFCKTRGTHPLHINEIGKALNAMSFVTEGRTKTARIWKGLRLMELHAVEQKDVELHAVEQETSAALNQAPKATRLRPELVMLPLKELEERLSTISPASKTSVSFPTDDAVNALLLKNMMGLVETRTL